MVANVSVGVDAASGAGELAPSRGAGRSDHLVFGAPALGDEEIAEVVAAALGLDWYRSACAEV